MHTDASLPPQRHKLTEAALDGPAAGGMISLIPFGRAGAIALNLRAVQLRRGSQNQTVMQDLLLGFGALPTSALAFDASACVDGPASEGVQVHFECMRFVFRSSRHFSHCDTGRPFFLISKSGRSVCWQFDERWPFMQASLQCRGTLEGNRTDILGGTGQTRRTSCR